ncbi:MAG: hypothetical protein ACP5OZ_00950 [Candidatus Woesearchaeota archaeon]
MKKFFLGLIKNKKGDDKSLQMIFGLFVLLIISLVVLSLFFRFTRSGTGTMTKIQEDWFAQNKVDEAIDKCKTKLDSAKNIDGIIDFCKSYVQIDFDGNKNTLGEKYDKGRYIFCQDKIPCFLLISEEEENKYNGAICKKILSQHRPDSLEKLMYDTPDGDCDLPVPNDPKDYPNSPNWVVRYGYYKEGKSQ